MGDRAGSLSADACGGRGARGDALAGRRAASDARAILPGTRAIMELSIVVESSSRSDLGLSLDLDNVVVFVEASSPAERPPPEEVVDSFANTPSS